MSQKISHFKPTISPKQIHTFVSFINRILFFFMIFYKDTHFRIKRDFHSICIKICKFSSLLQHANPMRYIQMNDIKIWSLAPHTYKVQTQTRKKRIIYRTLSLKINTAKYSQLQFWPQSVNSSKVHAIPLRFQRKKK